jgi:hypothetical protein
MIVESIVESRTTGGVAGSVVSVPGRNDADTTSPMPAEHCSSEARSGERKKLPFAEGSMPVTCAFT